MTESYFGGWLAPSLFFVGWSSFWAIDNNVPPAGARGLIVMALMIEWVVPRRLIRLSGTTWSLVLRRVLVANVKEVPEVQLLADQLKV